MTRSTATVLVTDGEQRSSLAVVRSLGRAGYRVLVTSVARRSLAGASRYAAHRIQVPDALGAPTLFAEAIADATRKWQPDVVVPMTDASLRSLLPARQTIRGTIPFGALDVVRHAADKPRVLRLAESLGMPVPQQVVLAHPAEQLGGALPNLTWPVVVKPGSSVSGDAAGQVKLGVAWAHTPAELSAIVHSLPLSAFPLLLQNRIEGPGTGVFVLRWDSRTRALFAHKRIREKPPSGGVSVCSESVVPDPALVAQAEALLAALDWRGPAMVEFKRDVKTGIAYLMEVNGRFWGSLQLAVDAGVDFPRLLVEAAMGHSASDPPASTPGVRMRWWWGDLDHLIARLRQPRDATPFEPSRLQLIRTFLLPGRRTHNEVFRWRDPGPALRETVEWFGSLLRGS